MIAWNSLTDQEFESLCYDVLVREGYKNLRWMGRTGGDRARDIIAEKVMRIAENIERNLKCIAQCKKYLSRPPSPSDLESTFAWAEAHQPDILLIMVPNTLTPDTHDWLDMMQPQKRYHIFVYDEKNFEQFFDHNGDIYLKHFGKERVSPRRLIVSLLLGKADQTLQTMLTKTSLSREEAERTLKDLEDQRMVSWSRSQTATSYHLRRDFATFESLAKEFLVDETKRFEFLSSEYCQSLIGPELVDHIESRFHLTLNADQKAALPRLLRISPSALNAALVWPTAKYDTAYAHIRELGLKGEDLEKWNQSLLTEFMSTLLEKALADLRDPDVKTALAKNGVEGYDIGIKIKMANSKELVLGLGSEVVIMLLKAAGPVKAGQLVSATDPDLYVRTGDILLHLELFEQAIAEYDRAISEMKDKDKSAAAWNNKGVCYMALQRWRKAIPCFEKALEFNPSMDQPRENIEKCRRALEA